MFKEFPLAPIPKPAIQIPAGRGRVIWHLFGKEKGTGLKITGFLPACRQAGRCQRINYYWLGKPGQSRHKLKVKHCSVVKLFTSSKQMFSNFSW